MMTLDGHTEREVGRIEPMNELWGGWVLHINYTDPHEAARQVEMVAVHGNVEGTLGQGQAPERSRALGVPNIHNVKRQGWIVRDESHATTDYHVMRDVGVEAGRVVFPNPMQVALVVEARYPIRLAEAVRRNKAKAQEAREKRTPKCDPTW
jgi:hypothetical protein